MEDFLVPESCIVIVAHPDDIEFTCAGTLARWANSGAAITYVLCTSGEVGIDDPSISVEEAARIRETEQEEAGRVIGVDNIVFLREPDGQLQPTMALRKRLVQEIRRVRPEVVVCWDPTILWHGSDYINHPDHRAAAEAALDATFPAAGQPKLFQELEALGMTAFKPRKIYISGSEKRDLIVDIDRTMDTKLEALKAHKSQLKGWDPAPMLKKWAEETANECEFEYGEAFRVISLESDEDWEQFKGDVLLRLESSDL